MKSILFIAVFALFIVHYADANKWKDRLDKLPNLGPKQIGKSLPNSKSQAALRVDKEGGSMYVLRRGKILNIRVKKIAEMDANGTLVNAVDLSKLDCTLKKSKDNNTDYTVPAVSVQISCGFSNGAAGQLDYLMFKEDGTITDEGNEYPVREGGVKMNLEITNWPNQAAALDVVFGMKCGLKALGDIVKGLPPKRAKKAEKYVQKIANRRKPEGFNVCPEARVVFAGNYKGDSVDKNMVEGFPKANEELPESESEITLRFAGRNIVYDPVAEVGDDIEEEIAAENSGITFLPNFLLVIAAFVVGQIKFF